jgi:competence protein ComEC
MAASHLHKVPFLRLLFALASGIILQWYIQFSFSYLFAAFAIFFAGVLFYSFTSLKYRYRLSAANGIITCFLLAAIGGLLVWSQDVRNNQQWFGHQLKTQEMLTVTLEEPLVEKNNSYKAMATVTTVTQGTETRQAEGKMILYFKKDSVPIHLQYGDQISFQKPLQEIKNAGNPGSFDYKTYCLYQGITHQVFLSKEDYLIQSKSHLNTFRLFIFNTRKWVINTLQQFISGEKEQGLAEALLIGYKDDLDKNLIQAYSNTGVVHIIAISGLHLGLIYGLLLFFTKPLKRQKNLVWLRLLLIISALWLFSILAGAQPSVLRSALMFSIIALGEVLLRRSNIFNTLACSAFVLLCINPFWLWDVGFQLSYSAVLSIVLFFKPVYHWFDFRNKLMDALWKLTAVTIAAQIFTLPISIYHFHQMPLLFLFTNFIAVPLSSLILLGEILLCALFFVAPLAHFIGSILHHLIYWMNTYVEQLDSLPFAVWNYLSITIVQTILLSIAAVAISFWLMEKQRRTAWIGLTSLVLFFVLRAVSFTDALTQKKLVVYNIPRHTAIDVINGRTYSFIGDTTLLYDDFARNFHLQPSRVLHRITPINADAQLRSFQLGEKEVVVIDKDMRLIAAEKKPTIDVLILSKNPKVYITNLVQGFLVRQIVLDGSVPPWKAALWKKDCDSLHIPCYNISEQGAFVMNW